MLKLMPKSKWLRQKLELSKLRNKLPKTRSQSRKSSLRHRLKPRSSLLERGKNFLGSSMRREKPPITG